MPVCWECGEWFDGDRRMRLCDRCRDKNKKRVRSRAQETERSPYDKKEAGKPVKSLDEMAREAREHGMTYGKYMLWLEQERKKQK